MVDDRTHRCGGARARAWRPARTFDAPDAELLVALGRHSTVGPDERPPGRPSPRPRTRGRADGDPGLGRPLGAYGVGWRRCQEFTDGRDGGCGRAGGDWGGLVEQPVGSTGSRVSGVLRRIAMIPPVVVLDVGVAQLAISGVARGLLGQQEAALGGGPEGGIREGRACCVARAACLRTRRRRTVPAIAVRIRTRRRRTAPGVGTVRAAPGGGPEGDRREEGSLAGTAASERRSSRVRRLTRRGDRR